MVIEQALKTLKYGLGVYIAIEVASLLGLEFPLSAGVIAMLSIVRTRRHALKGAGKRLILGSLGLVLSALLFQLFGHTLTILALYILLYMPLTILAKGEYTMIMNVVLASHLLEQGTITWQGLLNEWLLLLIGLTVGLVLMIPMASKRSLLEAYMAEVEEAFRDQLQILSYHLLNLCMISSGDEEILALEKKLKHMKKEAFAYRDNQLLLDNNYYPEYFQMRLNQLYRLMYMREHVNETFVTQQEAMMLSSITAHLSRILGSKPDVDKVLREIEQIKHDFKAAPLPKERLEFEQRASLFQYLQDLEEFVMIKKRFLASHAFRSS